LRLIMKSFLRSFALYLWYEQKFQFLAKVKATSTSKLLDSLSRNDAWAELCSGEFNVAYCRDLEWKLSPPPPLLFYTDMYEYILVRLSSRWTVASHLIVRCEDVWMEFLTGRYFCCFSFVLSFVHFNHIKENSHIKALQNEWHQRESTVTYCS
jgi:hypothetical protein